MQQKLTLIIITHVLGWRGGKRAGIFYSGELKVLGSNP